MLGRYFRERADPVGDASWTGESVRGLSELPYHLTEGQLWDDLAATLTDFVFLENKVSRVGVSSRTDAEGEEVTLHTGAFLLLDDYDLALERFPQG
jgi:hypothetical protein